MRRFIIEQTEADLTSHSGLGLVGMAISRHTELVASVTRAVPLRHGIAHADVLKSYLGLLCIGKSDFEAVAAVREDDYFSEALGIGEVPSPGTLRQRLDERAEAFLPEVSEAAIAFLDNVQAPCSAVRTGHVALDADVTPLDNSQTKKEGVSRIPTRAMTVTHR
jgi:hypothetical protein